jgi:hypothetical protein
VSPGVVRVRAQPIERPMLDRVGQSRFHSVWFGGVPRRVVTGFGGLPRAVTRSA